MPEHFRIVQICVVSGKGGTGKTTVAAMAVENLNNLLVADVDVDAPNLHILLKPRILREIPFIGSKKARINENKCSKCDLCRNVCRFNAITIINGNYTIDDVKCSGCSLCYHVCSSNAITMEDVVSGKIYISETNFCPMVHAILNPGEENSGKLVAEVRKIAKNIAEDKKIDKIVLDGPPGIGCPVIASLTGVDLALVIVEPTLSGLSDMARIVDLATHFNIRTVIAVNKFDLNKDMSAKIEKYCQSRKIDVLAKIPYDDEIVKQMSSLTFPFKGKAAEEISKLWSKINDIINELQS